MAYVNLQPVGQYTFNPTTQTWAPQANTYVAQIDPVLKDYYSMLLAQNNGDVTRALRVMEEDYTKGMRISQEDYTKGTQEAQSAYTGSIAEQATTSKGEQRALTGNLLQRGVSQGGVADTLTGELKSRQDLRREAIDRALRKSESDLSLQKTRSQEDTSTNKIRTGEDIALGKAKFELEKGQEQRDKAMGLASEAYNREFTKQSTEKGFDFSAQSLAKMG